MTPLRWALKREGLDGGFIFSSRKNIVRYIRVDMMEPLRLEGFFHVSDTRGGGDYTVERVVRLESSGEILGGH